MDDCIALVELESSPSVSADVIELKAHVSGGYYLAFTNLLLANFNGVMALCAFVQVFKYKLALPPYLMGTRFYAESLSCLPAMNLWNFSLSSKKYFW